VRGGGGGGPPPPPPYERPVRLEVSVRTTDVAEAAAWVRGVERVGDRELVFAGDDLLAVYQSFCAAILLTRSVAEVV
jgi:D-aminopeptidase